MNYALKLFFPFYRVLYGDRNRDAFAEITALQLKEYKFLAGISHPNIVPVLDYGCYSLRAAERSRLPDKNIPALPFILEQLIVGKRLDDALRSYPLSAPRSEARNLGENLSSYAVPA